MTRIILSIAACLCLAGGQAFGGISYSGTSATASIDVPNGSDLHYYKASAAFSVSGTTLTVQLTNLSGYDAMVPTDMLTAVFFNLVGVGALTPATAEVAASSNAYNVPSGTLAEPSSSSRTGIGGEWAYASGINGQGNSTEGISSTGLGLFGDGNFPAPAPTGDLQGPPHSGAVDGVQYGITTASDNLTTGNGGISSGNSSKFIKNSAIFTLTNAGLSGFTFTKDTLKDVWFQYGTDLAEPHFESPPDLDPHVDGGGVPEPGSVIVWGLLGMVGVLYRRRRVA